MIKEYYTLTKPGIIKGNAITAIAGFLLASRGNINFVLFAQAIVGISFVVASGCVFNNYIDRKIDRKMERTKKRSLVTGAIPLKNAILFGAILGIAGVWIMFYTNFLTVLIASLGFFFYVVMYSIFKRRSPFGTIVGSISGAVPPVVGYVAVTNHLDMGALLLFSILVIWQMPHFYAIAIFRLEDYKAAGIPVLPIIKGMKETKKQMLIYIVAFIAVAALFTVFSYTGYFYLVIIILLGAYWFWFGIKSFKSVDDVRWARKMFGLSLLNLLGFCIMLSIDSFLH